jgi:mono/diheme cytochrome c family protein
MKSLLTLCILFFLTACGAAAPEGDDANPQIASQPTSDQRSSASTQRSSSKTSEVSVSIEKIYQDNCASCHGNQGQGAAGGTPLQDLEIQRVSLGVARMPIGKPLNCGTINATECRDLLAVYIVTTFGKTPSSSSSARSLANPQSSTRSSVVNTSSLANVSLISSSGRSSSSKSSVSSAAISSKQSSSPMAEVCNAPKPTGLSNQFGVCASCHGADGKSGFAADLPDLNFSTQTLDIFKSKIRNGYNTMPMFSETTYSDVSMKNDYSYFAYDSLCEVEPPSNSSCSTTSELLSPKLRRLTQSQFANTIKTVFGGTYSESIWPDFGDGIPTIGVSNNANALKIHSVNMESVYNSVDAITKQLIQQNTTVKNCISSTSNTCLDNLIDIQGKALWRRPVSTTEKQLINLHVTNVRNKGGNKSAQVEFILKSLMLSSNFLFRSEIGTLQNNNLKLNAYEIASLLSYALWDGPPDSTLYNLAQSGDLLNQATIETQIARMLNDSRFDQALVGFYRDYLKLDSVKTVTKVQELNFTNNVRQSLLTSASKSLGDQVADRDRDVLNVLAITQFYANSTIDDLFGVNVSTDAHQLITPPSNQRNTMLTHPAFLAVHSKEGGSGIVKRGVYTLEQLLCVEIGDPPPGVMEPAPPSGIDPQKTSTRDLLTMLHTSQVPCNACHVKIDPAGFGYENYDAIGRFRTTEKQNVPIDASGSLEINPSTVLTFSNNIEFTNALVNSPDVRRCLTKRFLESVVGEQLSGSSCELKNFQAQLDGNHISIRELALALARLESMRLRK